MQNSQDIDKLSNLPTAETISTTYENFIAECPVCHSENIFNRASDLCTFEPIAERNVLCLNSDCGKPFRIISDTVNNPHEMMIFDCYDLIKRKHYMTCMLNLAQAYEIFFSLFLRVDLLYKPYSFEPTHDISKLNVLGEKLYKNIKRAAFNPMRNHFLCHIVEGRQPKNLDEAEVMIASLYERSNCPKDADFEKLPNKDLLQMLKMVRDVKIDRRRNEVVHKTAYRPTLSQVKEAIEETRSILMPLTYNLEIRDDINWYIMKRQMRGT